MMITTMLFDLGNTRLKYAPLDADGSIGDVTAITHDGAALPTDWDALLPTRFDTAQIASVAAPSLRTDLLDTLSKRCARMSLARTQSRFGALQIAYPQPETLGVDRFLCLLAAHARPGSAWLIVGIGTAITLDLIDRDGLHRGGRIAPSPALMRAALHERAAQLPEAGGHPVAFADNTRDALRSGCDGAALALIDHGLRNAAALLGETPRLLLHGGGIDALNGLPQDAVFAPALVLEGLRCWALGPTNQTDTLSQ